ncbi:VP7 [Pata virus]|nr:VP7 [Pata virus]
MDAIAARALTILRACATLQETRATIDSSVMEVLGIAINRYNGLTQHAVTMRPTSQEQRNEMFFMCIDMMLAAANVNVGMISADYVQNLGTIGVLATPEIPYSIEAANDLARITGEVTTWGPDRQPNGYFIEAENVTQPGKYVQAAGHVITVRNVDSRIIQVSLNNGARGDIQAAFQGPDAVMIYFVWRRIATFSNAQGNSVNSPQGLTLAVGGVDMRPGRIVAWDGQNPITVHNPGNAPAMIQIEVVWYLSLDKTLCQYPSLHEQMYNVYSFRDPIWHGLRAAILNRTTLPNLLPPIFPPNDRDNVLILVLLASLADVYSVLKPNFTLFGINPLPGPINRAIARAAYQ